MVLPFLAPLAGALGAAGAASVVGAGISLAGGALSQRAARKEAARARAASDPAVIRRKAEAAGFNPLLFTGQAFGSSGAMAQTGQFGNAVQDASRMWLNHGIREQELELQRTQLQQENRRLTMLAEERTLRPQIGGVFARSHNQVLFPAVRPAGASAGGVDELTDGTTDLGSTGAIVAPGREVDVAPYTSGPGLTELDNSFTAGPIVLPGADGEPWGVDEVVTAITIGAPQVLYNVGRNGVRQHREYTDMRRSLDDAQTIAFPDPARSDVRSSGPTGYRYPWSGPVPDRHPHAHLYER